MSDVVVFSRFQMPATVPTSKGSHIKKIFEERVVDGFHGLVSVGEEDFKDFIETAKEDTLISSIIRRFESGDVSALSKVQGIYADVVGMPNNLLDAKNKLLNLERSFETLPIDIRNKFDNSFDKFVDTVSHVNSVDDFSALFDLKKNTVIEESSGDTNE